MQPVQDLTIEDRVSRTQYQFTVETVDAKELSTWVHQLTDRLKQLPQLADVASDYQDGGLQAYVEFDRTTASRLGITPAAIDNALYNAFGQRLVSTIFTQSNQYRVVLEVQPEFQRGLGALENIYVPSTVARPADAAGQAFHDRAGRRESHAAFDQPYRAVSGGDDLLQPRAGRVAGRCRPGDREDQARTGAARQRADQFSGRRARVPGIAEQRVVADPGRDRHHVHRAGRALRELHPSRDDSVDAPVRRRRRAAGADRCPATTCRSSRSSASSC